MIVDYVNSEFKLAPSLPNSTFPDIVPLTSTSSAVTESGISHFPQMTNYTIVFIVNAPSLFIGIAILICIWKHIKRFPTGLRPGFLLEKQSGRDLAAIWEELASFRTQVQKCRSGPETNWIFLPDGGMAISLTPSSLVPSPTFVDKAKARLENLVRGPVIWWPLKPKRVACPEGYVRVSWKCVCLPCGEIDFSS